MPAPRKLTGADVAEIRPAGRGRQQLSALADEFGVNRKTVRRRLDALELAEQEERERIARARLKRQVAGELRKLKQREQQGATNTVETAMSERGRRSTKSNPYYEWLDMRKNLEGPAFTEALGFVRMRTPDGKNRRSVERADVEQLLEEGWLLVPD